MENSEQIARQIVKILFIELADNGAVHSNISRVIWLAAVHKNITRVHVGVKKTVAKYLGEENFNAAFSQQFQIDLFPLEGVNVANRHTVNALADHYVLAGQRPVHLRDVNQLAGLKVPLEL